MKPYNTEGSKALYEETKKYLLDGVASSYHKGQTEAYPVCVSHGKGSRLYDVDGNEYIDYIGGLGAMLMGYSNPILTQALREQLKKGTHFAATTPELVTLSKLLTEVIPCAELVSFENSGTEANMYAWRLARAYTGKMKMIKFEGQYHGWADEQEISIDAARIGDLGERETPVKHMFKKGQRRAAADDVVVIPWNDLAALRKALELNENEVAAVVMEPLMCDNGPIPPLLGYLEGVKELTRQFGAVLIFDEVITGFRLALGGAQGYYKVTPDLAVYGKALTAGFTMAVIAGRRDVMTCGVPASGTFNGHPFAAAAAIAAITEYRKPATYVRLEKVGALFAEGLQKLGQKYQKPLISEAHGGLVTLTFTARERIVDFRDWLSNADVEFYNRFNAACRKYGVRITNKKGRLCISLTHTEEDIVQTLAIMEQAFIELT